jgi:putative Holliday junction resolvase
MMRIMGLDFGTKRIGVALSDELFITAQGRDTIIRKTPQSDIASIENIVKENGVSEIVVGLPLNMDSSLGPKAKETLQFVDDLSKALGIPVKTWDERLTSVQAEKVLLEADISRSRRRRVSDKIAAQVILQNYLDARKARDKKSGE